MRMIARVDLNGADHLPGRGSFVLAANHIGRLDVAVAYYALDRPDIIVMVAEKYKQHVITRFLTRLVNGIFIDRYNADFTAVRLALQRLKQGGVLAVTPEGTRSKSGNLIEGKPGGMYLAWKAGVPVLPVALTGTEDAVVKDRLRRLKRLDIRVVVGEPFSIPPLEGRGREAALEEYTQETMCRIACLLPKERRGVYADHPKLKQMLSV